MTVRVNKESINLREKLAEVDKPSGIAGEAMLRAETPQEQFNLIGAGRKNLIINGGFDVWQRGTSGTAGFVADRWRGTYATTQNKGYDIAVGNYLSYSSNNGATMYYGVELPVAGNAYPFVEGAKLTLSLKVKSTEPMGVTFGFRDGVGTGTFLELQRSYVKQPAGTNEWEDLIATVTVNKTPISSTGIVQIVLTGAINTTYQIAQVQLELGKVATPFEHRSYGEELALCQRYYEEIIGKRFGGVSNSGYIQSEIQCTVRKRTTPSITQSANVVTFTAFAVEDLTGQNSAFVAAGTSSDYGSVGYFSVSGATTGRYYSVNSTCVFKFDAEL